MTGLMLMVFMGLSAFAVDVGHWYQVGQQEQRAADSAAMAGVTFLPSNPTSAFSTAQNYSKINGFENGVSATTVNPQLDSRPSRLRVTVSKTVNNFFGSLLGVPTTAVSRTAVADYSAPIPLGSPCNEFGDDPDPNGHKSTNCANAGTFWANVGSPLASKGSGDAFQNEMATNTDYDPNGYFYSVTVKQHVTNLTIEAFDPAWIDVGNDCSWNNLGNAKNLPPAKTVVPDPSIRYAEGATAYCTGDVRYAGAAEVATQFTVRKPGTSPWNPLSFEPVGGVCTQIFPGFDGDLNAVLDKSNPAYTSRPDVAQNFRQWKNLCTIPDAQPGTYLVQVKTNGIGVDDGNGHNRFSLRAYGGSSTDKDAISVSGYTKMGIFANTPSGTSKFFLAKVSSSTRGQTLHVNLWDIGDGAGPDSTLTVLPPVETVAAGGTFEGCIGNGVVTGPLTGCQLSVSPAFNARWQSIDVPIDAAYTCYDTLSTGCWVRLEFFYGAGSTPKDTTSWTASVQGDPVRLVE